MGVNVIKEPIGGYFYYGQSLKSVAYRAVNARLLLSDIRRGVKRLPEYAYVRGYGSTKGSLFFLAVLDRHLDLSTAYRAKLTHNHQHWYTLHVYLPNDIEIVFKGVSGGYFGEGPRGCYDILKTCGFNERQCQKAFTDETFTVFKRNR